MTDNTQLQQPSPLEARAAQSRVYKYDNAKAFLIFLVILGHMNRGYVSDSFTVRWVTLWLYTFHMPAFIFLSGLMHRNYITIERSALGIRGETRMRWDKLLGFFICGFFLKIFIQGCRLAIGTHPQFFWIREQEIPWFLFVLGAYELVFYLMRYIDGRIKPVYVIIGMFLISGFAGYLPVFDDTLCSARFFNFLPIYALGYYMDMRKALIWFDKIWVRLLGAAIVIGSICICAEGRFSMYRWRKWFTGRRSYEFLQDFFPYAMAHGWWIRIVVWIIALTITFAIIAVFPNRNMGYFTTIGRRTFQIYFWHRPVCFWFRKIKLLPQIVVACGGKYDLSVADYIPGKAFAGSGGAMIAGFIIYMLIAAFLAWFFSLKFFEHPSRELLVLGARLAPGHNKSRPVKNS